MFALLSIILVTLTSSTHGSCLSVLNGGKCEQIQTSGMILAKQVTNGNKIIRFIILNSITDNLNLIDSLIAPLKQQLTGIKILNPPPTPIESSNVAEKERVLLDLLEHTVHNGNKQFWKLMVKTASLVLNCNRVSKVLFEYPGVTYIDVHGTSPMILDDAVKSTSPQLNGLLSSLDAELKNASKAMLDTFCDSLEKLFQDKIQYDYAELKANLLDYSKKSNTELVTVMMAQATEFLKNCVREIELIDSIVEGKLERNPVNLKTALQPARILVLERLRKILKHQEYVGIGEKLKQGVRSFKRYYSEIKTIVTQNTK